MANLRLKACWRILTFNLVGVCLLIAASLSFARAQPHAHSNSAVGATRYLGMSYIGLLLILSATLLAACDTASVPAPIVRYTAEYFQSFYVPPVSGNTLITCDKTTSGQWYVYVNIDEIDNTSAGATDFTFDPGALQAIDPNVTTHEFMLESYLDAYWQPNKIAVPAGQRTDNTSPNAGLHIHQGKIFRLMFDGPTSASDLRDTPPIVYNTTLSPAPILLPNPHQVISPPSSAQPTNQFLVSLHDKALVEAGPCNP